MTHKKFLKHFIRISQLSLSTTLSPRKLVMGGQKGLSPQGQMAHRQHVLEEQRLEVASLAAFVHSFYSCCNGVPEVTFEEVIKAVLLKPRYVVDSRKYWKNGRWEFGQCCKTSVCDLLNDLRLTYNAMLQEQRQLRLAGVAVTRSSSLP